MAKYRETFRRCDQSFKLKPVLVRAPKRSDKISEIRLKIEAQPGLGILKYNKKRSLAKNFEKEYKLSAVDIQPSTDKTFYPWKAVDRQPKAYILFQNF